MLANRVMMGRWKESGDAGPPVTRGLLGEWAFDDGSGQRVTDHSGNDKHGQLGSTSGADTNDPAWIPEGLSFAVGDHVVCPHIDLYTGGEFTFIIACKYSLNVDYPSIMGSSGQAFIYLHGPQGKIAFISDVDNRTISTEGALVPDTPQVITITYDGSYFDTYFDGSLDSHNGHPDAMSDGTGSFYFSDTEAEYTDDMEIYYALVYDRALSAQEVADAYTYIQARIAKREVTI